jgi:predicted nucleic acid-binding protein
VPSRAVLVDTGPLVALFDPSDHAHERCLKQLGRLENRRLVTTLAVLTEASYLLDFSKRAQQALLAFVARGAVEPLHLAAPAVECAALLMSKYQDLPMDFADATLMTLAEALGTTAVFTLDRRDFAVYRLGRRKLQLLPS